MIKFGIDRGNKSALYLEGSLLLDKPGDFRVVALRQPSLMFVPILQAINRKQT